MIIFWNKRLFPHFLVNTSSRFKANNKQVLLPMRNCHIELLSIKSRCMTTSLLKPFHIHVRQRLQWHEIIRRVEVCTGEQWSDESRAGRGVRRSLDTCMSIANWMLLSDHNTTGVKNLTIYVHNIKHLNVWKQMRYVSFMGIPMIFLF